MENHNSCLWSLSWELRFDFTSALLLIPHLAPWRMDPMSRQHGKKIGASHCCMGLTWWWSVSWLSHADSLPHVATIVQRLPSRQPCTATQPETRHGVPTIRECWAQHITQLVSGRTRLKPRPTCFQISFFPSALLPKYKVCNQRIYKFLNTLFLYHDKYQRRV